jgi:hypothetical protein
MLALFRLGRLRSRSLSLNPSPDKGQTISECAAVRFDDCQKLDGFAVDEADVLQIDGKVASVRPERGAKHVQVFPFNPPTYVKDLQIVFKNAIDSASHCVPRLEWQTSRRRKLLKI